MTLTRRTHPVHFFETFLKFLLIEFLYIPGIQLKYFHFKGVHYGYRVQSKWLIGARTIVQFYLIIDFKAGYNEFHFK